MAKSNKAKSASNGGANLGFEAKLWAAADALRNNMDSAEYTLTALRDRLLSKLLSGELRIENPDQFALVGN